MAKKKRKMSDWNRYVQKRRLQGASLKTIAAEWRSGKLKLKPRESYEIGGNPGHKSKSTRHTGRGRSTYKMAKKKSYRRRASAALKPFDILIGGTLFSLAEPKINQLTAGIGAGIPDDLAKFGLGYYAAYKQNNKYLKGAGYAAMFAAARNLSAGLGARMGATAAADTKPSGLLF